MKGPQILQPMPDREYYTAERCHIDEWSNGTHDPEVSVAHARVAPGVTTCWHRLNGITERYVLLSGRGLVEIGELPPTVVEKGAVVVIPPGCRQRIRNTGDDDLCFLAICSPRFEPAAYEDLEPVSAS